MRFKNQMKYNTNLSLPYQSSTNIYISIKNHKIVEIMENMEIQDFSISVDKCNLEIQYYNEYESMSFKTLEELGIIDYLIAILELKMNSWILSDQEEKISRMIQSLKTMDLRIGKETTYLYIFDQEQVYDSKDSSITEYRLEENKLVKRSIENVDLSEIEDVREYLLENGKTSFYELF